MRKWLRRVRLGPVVSVSKTIFAHRPANHLRRIVATVRKMSRICARGVIESPRAVHDKIGAMALFGIRHICAQMADASAMTIRSASMLAWSQSYTVGTIFWLFSVAAAKAIEGECCLAFRTWGLNNLPESSWVKLPVPAFKFPVLSIKIPCSDR
jgi:hypothetical protein